MTILAVAIAAPVLPAEMKSSAFAFSTSLLDALYNGRTWGTRDAADPDRGGWNRAQPAEHAEHHERSI